jgi:hypothetical protein
MTATRLVGVPLVIYPFVRTWLQADRRKVGPLSAALLLGIVATLGAGSYFGYCHLRFGHWDEYRRAQVLGWHMQPQYLAPFTSGLFSGLSPAEHETWLHSDLLSRLSVLVLALLLLAAVAAEGVMTLRGRTGWRERLPLYLGAFLLWWIPASAYWSLNRVSMLRYGLPVLMLLIPALLRLLARPGRSRLPRAVEALLLAMAAGSLALQLRLAWRYTHGLWVA